MNLTSRSFNSHVFADLLERWKLEGSPVLDRLIGAILILCTLVGIPGNLLSLRYFWSKLNNNIPCARFRPCSRSGKQKRKKGKKMSSSKGKDLPNLLYITICCIDICTCLASLPVTVSLFSDRYPVLFNSKVFCKGWDLMFHFLLTLSMFMVMMLSFCRCIAIVLPFSTMDSKKYLVAAMLYTPFLVAHSMLQMFGKGIDTFYFPDSADCIAVTLPTNYSTSSSSTSNITDSTMAWYSILEPTIYALELATPPVVAFISFAVCTVKLMSSAAAPTEASAQHNKRAAVTVTMFTGLFLLCNLPLFVTETLYVITISAYSYPGQLFSGKFMFWYSWLFSKVVCTVVNATLNPVLYYCRIPGLKESITNIFI